MHRPTPSPTAIAHPLRRQHLMALAALAAAACLLPGKAVHAQAWPSKPVTLVVPFAAGGTTDVLARALGEKLSTALGQPVIVENRGGAGATIGADYVAKAAPDGYTLLMGAVHHTIATSVYKKLSYDFQKSFAPITTVALVPNVLVVNAATPVKNVAELQSFLKAKPDKAVFGSNGNGTAQHLIGTWFGVLAPAATPQDIVTRLNAEMVKVIQSPDFKKRMQDIGAEPIGNTPAQMAEQIAGDTTRFAKLVADHKITTD